MFHIMLNRPNGGRAAASFPAFRGSAWGFAARGRHKASILMIVAFAVCFAAGPVRAASIGIDRVFSFDRHEFFYDYDDERTYILDFYTIETDPVVLADDSYDQMQLRLSPGTGNRFVVDDVGRHVSSGVDFQWDRTPYSWAATPYSSYTLTYTNGTGSLPAPEPPALFFLMSNGAAIRADDFFSYVMGGFAFDAMTIESSFGPYDGGGTYNIVENSIMFAYSIPGQVADDPGRFTHINAISDIDNDGMPDEYDPFPAQPLNESFGTVAVDGSTGYDIRINTGPDCGPALTDCRGRQWNSDFGAVTPQSTGTCDLAGGCIVDANAVFGCTDAATESIFKCEHWDPPGDEGLVYSFDLPDGEYLVNLLLMELYSGATQVGDRVFDIIIEEQVIYDDFDQVDTAGGAGIPIVRSALVTVADGNGLQIEFGRVAESPAIKGIEVLTNDCDSDGTPDHLEPDTDGDGVPDDCDPCPNDPNPTITNLATGMTYPTLQAALSAAVTGEAIEIGAGTLCEDNITFPNGVDLTLEGAGRDLTIIDGGGGTDANPILRLADTGQTEATVISDLTLRNGVNTLWSGPGAVLITNTSPEFREVNFEDNGGPGISGGAAHVLVTGSASPLFDRCIFAGGYDAYDAFGTFAGATTLLQCLFRDNATSEVLRLDGGPHSVVNCTVSATGSSLNVALFTVGGTVNAYNSAFEGSVVSAGGVINTTRCLYAGATGDNISGAATFVDAAGGDYRLAVGSLGIDAADYDAYIAAGGGATDLNGDPCPVDDAATADTGSGAFTYLDIGAYEFEGQSNQGTGDLVGVDFGQLADPQTTPTNWTFAPTEAPGNPDVFANLIEETGANSGWSVSIELIGDSPPDNRTVTFAADQIPLHTNPLGGLDGNTKHDDEDADVRIIWSGLTPGGLYDFWVFSGNVSNIRQTVTVSGGDTPIVFGDHIFYGRLNVNGAEGSSEYTLDSYAMQQTADGDGEITILITPEGNNVAVAGVALRAVCDIGDCNCDGSVDLTDYADFEACLLGPDGRNGTGCECFDFDDDGDNDLRDFATFQASFTD